MNRINFKVEGEITPGQAVANLQDGLHFLLDKGDVPLDETARLKFKESLLAERGNSQYGDTTRELVRFFQAQEKLEESGQVDESTATLLNKRLEVLGAFTLPDKTELVAVDAASPSENITYQIQGKVTSRGRASVDKLGVRIVAKFVGGKEVELGETKTNKDGTYQLSFSDAELRKYSQEQPDLQAHIFTDHASPTVLATSALRYNASPQETLNVLLKDSVAPTLQSEHETLTSALGRHYAGKLGELQETDERQDITHLANKTGWDARAVALAALADQFSQSSGKTPIPAKFFYALFRAGLPANEDAIYDVTAQTLETVWRKAAAQGVIPMAKPPEKPGDPDELGTEIKQIIGQFQEVSAQRLLSRPALAGVSSLKQMLTTSRLSDAQQERFAALYTANRNDMVKFWSAVGEDNAFGDTPEARDVVVKGLQVDGRLGFLTLNNAPLVQKLHEEVAGDALISDPVQLAQKGYHRAEKWDELLAKSDMAVPKEIPGKEAEQRANYAKYLAAQVRLSYPTAAIAEMIKSRTLPLPGVASDVPDQVHKFLTDHQGKFEIGVQPVEQYLKRNHIQEAPDVIKQVKRLQRVYQITPSDQAMGVLLKNDLDSGYKIVHYKKEDFVRSFGPELGGADKAALIYERGTQVTNVVFNIAISDLLARNGITLGASSLISLHSGSNSSGQIIRPQPQTPADDVIAYPTLEGLFGEMDFCTCDHCRSILSPAAYLVDLLHFLDRPAPPAGTKNPQTVLLERRPDIQHLPLTCENTNTALPYLDVVNEALEYFIANKNSLNNYQGHDTAGVASADLLASPQYVMDTAYAVLSNECFPLLLPFHQPLENLRRYFAKFDVALPLAMERLRQNDDLERGTKLYGWRDILMEEINLSRKEYESLTSEFYVKELYGFPATTSDAFVIKTLSNAKTFARRLNITYEDVVALLRTRFVNPSSDLIPKLERLAVPFATLKALKEGTLSDDDFDALLPTEALAPDPVAYGGDIKAWVKNEANYQRIMKLITLADPNGRQDPCSFEKLEFRYARPMSSSTDTSTRLGTLEFWRLLRFIRLWKKLGWTIEQTDATICALFRADMMPLVSDDIDESSKINPGFLCLLPRLGIVVRVLKALNLTPKYDLLPLLACWSPISVHGESALYRQLFLNPTGLQQDAIFSDNGYGQFLQKTNVSYTHSQSTLEPAILSLAQGKISYDHTAQHLSSTGIWDVAMCNALKAVAGVTPAFKTAVDELYTKQRLVTHTEALRAAFALTDEEYGQIIRALGYDDSTPLTITTLSQIFRRGWLARKLKISVRELLLLIKLTGLDPFAANNMSVEKTMPEPAILRLSKLLQALKERSLKSAAALYLIWNQDLSGKSAPDPQQLTELARTLRGDFVSIDEQFAATDDPNGEVVQTRLALVYGQEAADTFCALLDDKLVLDVDYTHPTATLEATITEVNDKLGYDNYRHRLSYTGVLTASKCDALKGVADVKDAFKTAIDALFAKSEHTCGAFFTRYAELKPLYNTYIASTEPEEKKRTALLAAFRPDLARRRKRQQALQRLSTTAGVDLTFAQAILDPPQAPYPLHAVGKPDEPALNDLLALDQSGLQANSGIWCGQVEAPESGFYNLIIEADAKATVALTLDGLARPLTRNGNLWRNTESIELKAGVLYDFVLSVDKVKDVFSIKWETQQRPREAIPARYLYPPGITALFSTVYIRFLKAAALASELLLTANELAHFATVDEYKVDNDDWLNTLTVSGDPNAAIANALLKPFKALLDYAHIKAGIAPGDERLLNVLQNSANATQTSDSLLFTLTRWDPSSLDALLHHFGKVDAKGNAARSALKDVGTLRCLSEAFALLQLMGIAGKTLLQVTTNEPTGDTVRTLQAALRARYDVTSWRDVIQPINDAMRGLQRDALLAYILHQMRSDPKHEHIDTADKLFEYFLMDVQMEPCMQTSRIRHALSSVQLFIERCFMNLEPEVSLEASSAKQWEWMKRYRVWEANRKVFLFPENWLEPELRDDKSPFFKEIESELLQSDITEETATTALLNYLAKLEEVAKLEPCAICHVEAGTDKRVDEIDIDHVIARTVGANRKYYYRRREGLTWTPWEQIKLDIEDNPVLPVVWKDRLLLFWLRILKQSPMEVPDPGEPQSADPKLAEVTLNAAKKAAKTAADEQVKVTIQAVLCWSEYYNGKWQAVKTSDINDPMKVNDFATQGTGTFARSLLRLSVEQQDDILKLVVRYEKKAKEFHMYNTHSLPEHPESPELAESVPVSSYGNRRTLDTSGNSLVISCHSWGLLSGKMPIEPVIRVPFRCHTIEPLHPLKDAWTSPFFFEDSRHVFYVTVSTQSEPYFSNRDDYGISMIPKIPKQIEIPRIIFQTKPELEIGTQFPNSHGPVRWDPTVTDPVPGLRFVTEDVYIRQLLDTTAMVKYGSKEIGPSGATVNINITK